MKTPKANVRLARLSALEGVRQALFERLPGATGPAPGAGRPNRSASEATAKPSQSLPSASRRHPTRHNVQCPGSDGLQYCGGLGRQEYRPAGRNSRLRR